MACLLPCPGYVSHVDNDIMTAKLTNSTLIQQSDSAPDNMYAFKAPGVFSKASIVKEFGTTVKWPFYSMAGHCKIAQCSMIPWPMTD